MNDVTASRHGQRGRTARSTRLCPSVEVLEDRTLPSVNLVEVEPNNNRAHANVITRVLETPVTIDGKVNSLGDHDWFKIQLKAGDVFRAALKGKGNLDPTISLVNSAGALMIANDDSFLFGSTYLPKESPLPSNHSSVRDSEIYYVIRTPGTYYLDVSAFGEETSGKYQLDVMVARPGLESQPVGTKQILFLDFDGAKVNFNKFSDDFITGKRTLAPLAASLPDWGLTGADENAVIDAILAKVTDLCRFLERHRRHAQHRRLRPLDGQACRGGMWFSSGREPDGPHTARRRILRPVRSRRGGRMDRQHLLRAWPKEEIMIL